MDTAGYFRGEVPVIGGRTALAKVGDEGAAATQDRRSPQPPPRRPSSAVATSVCVVLPVYNESKLVAHTFEAVLEFALQNPSYHFVFANDGSKDNTAQILRDLIAQSKTTQVKLIDYPVNRGKGRTVSAAVLETGGDLVCFTDGDLAYSLDHLPLLAEQLRTHDVVIGNRNLVHRTEKNTKIARQILGWGFNKLARLALNLPYTDTQAGLKGFRREAAQHIFAKQQIPDFSFDVELVFLARHYGYKITEIPARVSEAHSYKVSKVNLLRDPLKMFVDLVRIRINSIRGLYE